MNIAYSAVRKGMLIKFNGVLYEVLDSEFIRMQQRKPVMRARLRDVLSGKVKEIAFQPSDSIEEVELEKMPIIFIYFNKDEYWFNEKENPSNRFSLKKEQIKDKINFLKRGMELIAILDKNQVLNIELPIKVDLLVTEAPPAVKGNTSSGGNKVVIVETGAKIITPLFIESGDIIKVNTRTGEYSERVKRIT